MIDAITLKMYMDVNEICEMDEKNQCNYCGVFVTCTCGKKSIQVESWK